jgi:hypothetical protein
MNIVPVSLGYQYAGLAYCTGLLRDEGDDLMLEYQSREAFFGDLFRSSVRQARIPRDRIASVTLHKTWLGLKTELVIQTTSLEPVADVPGMNLGRLALGVKKSHRPAAERLVAELNLPGPVAGKPSRDEFGLE